MKLAGWITIAIVALVVGVVAEHHGGIVAGLGGLLGFGAPPVLEHEEAKAEAAGTQAAEERTRELDAQTDDEVAADSDVAAQHDADAVERYATDAEYRQAALDDLHRRLHEHLQGGVGEGEDGMQRISESDIDNLLADLRKRLLSGAAQPDA